MSDYVCAFRIYEGVVVVPVDNSNILVLDISTGHQVHALPSAGKDVFGICVFDGLSSEYACLIDSLTPNYCPSTANEGSLEDA